MRLLLASATLEVAGAVEGESLGALNSLFGALNSTRTPRKLELALARRQYEPRLDNRAGIVLARM